MTTKVVSAFPGTGKSYFVRHQKSGQAAIDLDSNSFTAGHTPDGKVRNPDFPRNYLTAIEAHIGKCSILFVSPHIAVLSALRKSGIAVTLIYPDRTLKSEYMQRFKQRGSPESFVQLLDTYWDDFLEQLEGQKDCEQIVLQQGQYVSGVL